MKLPAAVLATLCAVGCEIAQAPEPQYPTQPVETYEVVDPTVETIEDEPRFAQPPADGVAPVRRVVVQPVPAPHPQITHSDPCPACGMG